ncbi:AraC family transcriptional regulator [Caballeronia mineralivorans PML1(12)]|uniref:AraC family transcriptional regulator n=1 Tax=Caballeronia mineralivorans PML1(12) TaxID=908627 RepID=A0A0J1CU74_9BURK|nr:AraC family transcriptional regulator [Caballeronia mineralivorans]KLU24144.1 AraC family transcriptional regulator [Caballeronia mineralivorans PML1(12)]
MSSHSRPDGSVQAATPDVGIVRSSFSTHGTAVDRQLLAWRDRVGHIVDVPPSNEHIAGGFSGRIDRYAVGDFVFTDTVTDAMQLERSVARVSTDARRDYVFHVFAEGEVGTVTGMQKKRSAANSVRGIIAFDLDQPFHVERPACHVLTLFVPKEMVAAAFPDVDSIHGRVVELGAPLTQLVMNHATALSRNLLRMSAALAAQELDAGAQLLLAAFHKQARLTGDARAAVQVAVMSQVRRFIEANLNQPDLSPSSVVHALQLKRATIYRWFEHEGGLGAYIRNRRLREAADELVRFPHLQVIDIAYGLGFNSASDFTRAFRRAYGMSPQDARARAFELQRASRLDMLSSHAPGGK